MKRENTVIVIFVSLLMMSGIMFNLVDMNTTEGNIGDGISSIGKPVLAADGHVNITIDILSLEWTPIGYNVTANITGFYNETGEIWNGTATMNMTGAADGDAGDQIQYPYSLDNGNFTLSITAITDADAKGITDFQIDVYDWCVWDVVNGSAYDSAGDVYPYVWETNSDNDTNYCFLKWYPGTLYWVNNGTTEVVGSGHTVQIYNNGTAADWSLTDSISRIAGAEGCLWLGPFDSSDDGVAIVVNGSYTVGGSDYNVSLWSGTLAVILEIDYDTRLDTFVDDGASGIVANRMGEVNLIEVIVYDGYLNPGYNEHAPPGLVVYLNLTNGDDSYFLNETKITDYDGFVRWGLNQTVVTGLGGNSTLYYRVTIGGAWVLVQRFGFDNISTSSISGFADSSGIHIRIAHTQPDLPVTAALGDFVGVVGLPDTYVMNVLATGNSTFELSVVGNPREIYANIPIYGGVLFTVILVQCLDPLYLTVTDNKSITLYPVLEVTERQLYITEDEVGLSGTISADATYNASEDTGSGMGSVGSGSVINGSFFIAWIRYQNATYTPVNYSVEFDSGTDVTWVNGTYSSATPTLGVVVEQVDVLNTSIHMVGRTARDFNYYVYNDTGYQETGTGEAIGWVIDFDKNTTIGTFVYNVKFNASVDGTEYYRWYNGSYSNLVEVFDVVVESVEILNTTVGVSGTSSFGFNWYIYEEGSYIAETGTELENGFAFEFTKNVSLGLHNYSIYFNTTISGSEHSRWFNGTYFINFDLSIDPPEVRDTSIEVRGTTSIAANYYVYLEGVYGGAGYTGSVTPTTFSFFFTKTPTAGLHNYSIYFNVTASNYIWKNGSYYVSGLVISDTLYTFSTDYNYLSGTVSLDCNYTVWENGTIDGPTALSAGSFAISWARNSTIGYYQWAVKFNDSLSTRWVNGSYQILPAINEALAITGMSYSDTGTNLTFYWNTNWWNTTGQFYFDNVAQGTAVNEVNTLTFAAPTVVGDYNISVNVSSGATTIWVNYTYSVVDLGALYLTLFDIDVSNSANITGFAMSSWGNATVRIYENNTLMDSGAEGELLLYSRATGVGNYSIALEIDGGATTVWVNTTSYSVVFSLDVDPPEVRDANVEVRGTTNVAASWYVYSEGIYDSQTGAISPVTFSFFFTKKATAGLHNYSIYFNVTATVGIWKNGSYYVTGLVVSDTLYTFSTDFNFLSGMVSLDCDYTVWENGTIVGPTGLSAGSFAISWARNSTIGYYEWSVKFNDSLFVRWVNGSYQILPEITDELAITGMSYSDAGTNLTFYWNTNWWNTTGQFYYNNVAQGVVVNEGNTLSLEVPNVVGDYNISINVSSGVSTVWVNCTYSVEDLGALYLTLFDINVSNPENITAFAMSSWTNATVRIYENNVLQDTDTEGELLLYAKATAVGNYSISLEIDGGATTVWVNTTSYEIPIVYAWSYVSIYGPDAIGIDPLLFKVYVNDTRVWSLIPQFYNRTDYVYNITILNFLNETISSTTYTWERFIDVSIDVYVLYIYSQLDEEFIYFNLTSTAGATWTGYVPPRRDINIAIYASTNYTYAFTVIQGGKGGTFGGIINIDADYGIIINAYNLMDIFRGIEKVGGGTLSPEDITAAMLSAYGGPMGQIQFFAWISAIMLFVGLYAVPFVRSRSKKEGGGEIDVAEVIRTGGLSGKKPGKTPEQLKPYEFGKGRLNPKHKGKAMDDIGDFVWGRLKDGRKSGRKSGGRR